MSPFASASFDHVFVGGVPPGTTEVQLRAAFALVGVDVDANAVELVLNRVTGLPRGFAFVALRVRVDTRSGTSALGRLRTATVEGHPLDVQSVPARAERANRDRPA